MSLSLGNSRVPTAQGKQGKWPKKLCQGKRRELGNFAKTRGILHTHVENFMILKNQDTVLFFKASFAYETVRNFLNLHRKNYPTDRENKENLKIGFEWAPLSIILKRMP